MKTNNMSQAFKIIIFAITSIIVCLICVVAIKTTNEGKAMVNAGTTQVKEVSESYANIDQASYDNTNIIGSALVDLIETSIEDDDYLSIWVKTNSNATTGVYYHYILTQAAGGNTISSTGTPAPLLLVPKDTTNTNYINPNAQFTGKIYKDANKNIIAISFDQMD